MKCYVFSSVVRTVMSISLDNPGFLLDVSDQVDVHQPDASSIASGSSSSGESTRRSCPRCHGRMSSISLYRHVFCVKCRGSECDHNSRCDDCIKWSKEEMDSYVKLRKSLKAKSRPSKSSSRSSLSPPRITAPDIDFNAILTTQLDSVHKSVDEKFISLSDSLMSNMSLMFDKHRSELVHTSDVGDPAVPRQSVSHTEPPLPPRPTSTKRCESLRGLGEGVPSVPQRSGLAHHRVDSRSHALGSGSGSSRDPPLEGGESSQDPGVHANLGAGASSQAPEGNYHPDDDDEDDRESIGDPPAPDKTYVRLIDFIYDRFIHSKPSAAAHVPPRCDFESYFSISDPPSASRQFLMVYTRVAEIIDASADRAARLARESRPLHRVVPLRRKLFNVGDRPDFCNARYVNPEFSRISQNKNILKSRNASMSLSDLEKVRSILAGDSQCFWLLSSLLVQLREDGYRPSDPALFDKNITSLSAALASQTTMAAGVTDFISSKCRESYLFHASCSVAESVKRDLLAAPGSDSLLFDPELLERLVSQLKEDSLISSTASLASLSKSAARGRGRSASSDRYASPLEHSRPGPSGYRKRSTSTPRGFRSKRGRGGRGMAPSSGRGRGFRR